jgi:hypothetical protein
MERKRAAKSSSNPLDSGEVFQGSNMIIKLSEDRFYDIAPEPD